MPRSIILLFIVYLWAFFSDVESIFYVVSIEIHFFVLILFIQSSPRCSQCSPYRDALTTMMMMMEKCCSIERKKRCLLDKTWTVIYLCVFSLSISVEARLPLSLLTLPCPRVTLNGEWIDEAWKWRYRWWKKVFSERGW